MKKAAILTLYGNCNFGNKLQNYAVQEILKKYNFEVSNIINVPILNDKKISLIKKYKFYMKLILNKILYNIDVNSCCNPTDNKKRQKLFLDFNKYINNTNTYFSFSNIKKFKNYDYYIIGSDQVWNPYYYGLSDFYLANFTDKPKIAFSASFGVEEIPEKYHSKIKCALNNFKSISVREFSAKKIIEDIVGRKDVEVLIDPTMLLTTEEWDLVSKKPVQIDSLNGKKYILTYFLGNLSINRKEAIEKVAKENDCEIVNILDKESPFYECGPSEFLYLEKNAFLICTDSFHSSVFAILYNRSFVIFDREKKGTVSMNSRLDTLISKFKLKNRKYNGKFITQENINHNYDDAYKILDKERKKSDSFFKKSFDIKEIDNNGK